MTPALGFSFVNFEPRIPEGSGCIVLISRPPQYRVMRRWRSVENKKCIYKNVGEKEKNKALLNAFFF